MQNFEKVLSVSWFLVGVGVLLHYYAYAIAWGVAKGWAKVQRKIQLNLNKFDSTLNEEK